MSGHAVRSGDRIDDRALRDAFGAFPTGVTVVTVGAPVAHGMTANSFTAVSLSPPLLLICVHRQALMHGLLGIGTAFGISVLAEDQRGLAGYFSDRSRPGGTAQFHDAATVAGRCTGVPLIAHALAQFECEVRHRHDGGDHTIVVGGVLSLHRADGEPLIFRSGRYGTTNAH
ncbi:flavin reductase family protein [Winogradskya humida]|uniref:Oxidoreductase n=1 Tax=Winogradskya humida TaxID=113566 RepID=A0ABQ4A2J1_9ACTN|nr:flavin reductase family protein [Actinoplanes humidus]GIE24562.1 oxidoreductase [Actinoplanes humidus]